MLDPQSYVRQMDKVDGWLSPGTAEMLVVLSGAQHDAGVTGAVAEIGIHHGKLFILLALLRRDGERGVAVDVFENQAANVDGSGLGDRAHFERNLRWAGVDPRTVDVVAQSSLEVTPEQLTGSGPVRLFSIDGGHTREITENDLWLAEAALADGGIVVVDDVFNWEWPGVAEGTFSYLQAERSRLVPFAIGPQKLLLTQPEFVARYQAGLAAGLPARTARGNSLFGSAVVLVEDPAPARLRVLEAVVANETFQRVKELPGIKQMRPAVVRALTRR